MSNSTNPPSQSDPPPSEWLTPVAAGGTVTLITFWTAVVVWPKRWDLSTRSLWPEAAVAAGVIAIVGALALYLWKKDDFAMVSIVVGVLGVAILLISTGSGNLGLDDAKRFPIAVGGLALGGVLLGTFRYQTIRAAASIGAVVLIIGVLTVPGGRDAVGEENVGTIVGWMAILLGVNGAAEAGVQLKGGEIGAGDLE